MVLWLYATEILRDELKRPLGQLVTGSVRECIKELNEFILRENPTGIFLVGDTIARTAIESGINPDVIIIDKMEMRQRALSFKHNQLHVFHTSNTRGTISLESWKTVEEAISRGNSVVLVDGEEDLLTLIVILSAPSGSFVVYGQPNQGIVIVRVSPDKKKEIQGIVERMERRD